MSLDKQKLELARRWAEHAKSPNEDGIWTTAIAAAEVIATLPDAWVDAEKVRELANMYRNENTSPGGSVTVPLRIVVEDLQTLLPTPRVVVRMGAWAMHPEHGKVMIVSAKPDSFGRVEVSCERDIATTGSFLSSVKLDDLSPLPDDEDDDPEGRARVLATESDYQEAPPRTVVKSFEHATVFEKIDDGVWSNTLGEQYPDRQMARIPHTVLWEPEEAPFQWPAIPEAAKAFLKENGFADTAPEDEGNDPVFDSARMYYDQDGDTWAFNPGVGGWVHFDATDRGYSMPPAEYGPYTRIEKGDS